MFDIVIIGDGIISLTLACGLHDIGLRIAVLIQESSNIKINTQDTASNLHISVINTASEKLLTYLNIWSEIVTNRVSCCHSMEVWDRDGFGRILFNDISMGYSHLYYVIENSIIYQSLQKKIQQYDDVFLISSIQFKEIIWKENNVCLIFRDESILTARLVVGTDEVSSWLRYKANIPLIWWDYCCYALVAIIHTTESHDSVTRQIFHDDGMLTVLPLVDSHLCSIIWSLPLNKANEMRNMEPKMFGQFLCMTINNCLGFCSLRSNREIFPLVGSYSRQFAGHRLALIGNAAYTMHPFAGQSINFSFMDAAELIEELRYLHSLGKDIGQYSYLRKFERIRKYNTAIILTEMQILHELFSGSNLIKKILRNTFIKFSNITPGIKEKIFRYLIGLSNLPDWLC